MKIFLGIDLSLNRTGYVVLPFKGNDPVDRGLIEPKKLRGEDRLAFIFRKVSRLLNEHRYQAIGLEGYSFGSRGGRAFSIGEAGGIVKLLLHSFKQRTTDPYYIFPPTTVKKFTTGKGNCQKSNMLKAVYKLWDLDTEDEDIADAYAIAQLTRGYHFKKYKVSHYAHLKQFQRDVISNLLKKQED